MTFTVYGSNGKEIEDRARAGCEAYFGSGIDFDMTVEANAHLKSMGGAVLGYEGAVYACLVRDKVIPL